MNERFLIDDDTTTQTAVDGGRRVAPTNEFIEFELSEVDQSISERFEKQVLQYPRRVAVTSSGQRVTYKELNRRANQIAQAILDARGGRSEPVALLLDQGPMMIAALLGALKSGKFCVTLDAAYPPDRIEAMLDDSESPLIVTDGGHFGRVAQGKASKRQILNLDDLKTPLTSDDVKLAIPPDALADLVYTSGSTGVPKGIPRSHRMLLHGARLYTNHCHLSPDDRLTLLHSISFAAGVAELWAALLNGASTNYWDARARGVAGMADWLIDERITFFHWFPTAFRQFVRTLNGDEEFPDLRVIQLGSEVLIDRDLELYRRHFGRHTLLANRMGTSETVVFSFFFADHDTRLSGTTIPIGYEAQDKEVLIFDERGNELGFNEVGEIAVRTRYLSPGYWRRPDLTVKSFLPDPDGGDRRIYKTGDLGLIRPDGCIEYFGRKDTQVKIRGYRVEVSEIESLLLQLESVRSAVVVPREDDNGVSHLVAFVIPAETQPPAAGRWKQFLSEKLPGYMVPSAFVTLDSFPLTPSGKVDRRSLSKRDIDEAQLETEYVAPRTSLEQELCRIWTRSLGLQRVGVRDDFFALGGHSLTATDVVSRIREAMNVELPLVALFESPNIEQLAGRIESLQSDNRAGVEVRESLPAIVPSPAERYEPFPLTDVQQAYWVGRSGSFELGDVTTHSYVELDCLELDLERLQSTWQQLIERHDMLRVIVQADGTQRVLQEVPEYRFEVVDLRDTDKTAADREINAVRERMSHQVLPSDRWPLFEIRACRLGERHYRLHFSFDALILDAWSRRLLFHEWRQLYECSDTQASRETPSQDAGDAAVSDPHGEQEPRAEAGVAGLPPLELTFRDYVLAERRLRETKQYERAKRYWLDRLPTLPAAPELPLAKSPTAISSTRFVRRTARLEENRWEQLKRRAGQSGLTPSGALLAAFSEVLKRWSKNPRFTLNLTLYNRRPLHPQVNDVVGEFTSLMLLEVDNSGYDTFASRARWLEKQFWNDLDHCDFSAIEVLREMARLQDAGPKAAMPVVFTSLLHPTNRLEVGEKQFWMGEVVFRVAQTPQVWLDHVVFEEAGEVTLTWDAVADLFPDELLDDMFDSYCRLLNRLSENPQLWNREWSELAESLLPPGQKKRLAAVNATKSEIPEGLLQTRFVEQARRQPQKPALVSAERTLSYEQLWHMSNQIGRELSQMGAKPNHLIAVVMEKGWEQVAAVLGVLQSGAAYLPIEANLPQQRIRQLLELGEVELALTQSKFDRQLDWPESIRRLSVDDEPAWADVDESELEPVQSPEDLAYVIYTSGSTGQPKGVAIDHRGALNTIVDVNRRFGVGGNDRVLALSSLSFDLSVYDIFGTLAAGGTIVMPEAAEIRNPARWAEWMQREQVTLWNSVPALMELLVEWAGGREGVIPDSLRLVLLSGDWIPVSLPGELRSLVKDVEVISLGGATEASIWSILYPIESVDPSWTSIPYGKPMANQTFHVLDDELEPCPVWTTGRLFIGGIGLARGYWRDKQTTEERFIFHPRTGERLYRTGDLGRFLPDGNIEFLGREDFQVKIQGHRIELGEIEAALGQHRDVKQAVVTAVGSSTAERRLVAYVVGEERTTLESEELRRFLLDRLPGYMVPTQFIALSSLPLTANGKIDRRALPPPAEAGETIEASAEARPQDDGETVHEQIAPLICGVMCLETIEPNTSLLTLGATSIDMIRIINLLEKNFGFRPSINEFYREPTVAYLAAACDRFQRQKPAEEPFSGSPACPHDPASYPLLNDPIERDEFKYGQPGLRRFDASRPSIGLQRDAFSVSVEKEAFLTRRSYRRFANTPIPGGSFSAALAAFRQIQIEGRPKYLYGSAGGLYPVQSYLYVKPNRVAGLDGGYYYYDPVAHRVVRLSDEDSLADDLFDPFINGPVFERSAFGLFLVAQIKAIAPMYGEQSLQFAAIEAGMMAQLVQMTGPEHGIGYCQIGRMNFDPLRQPFRLEESHVPMHALLGGLIGSATSETWSPFQEGYPNVHEPADDREEGVL